MECEEAEEEGGPGGVERREAEGGVGGSGGGERGDALGVGELIGQRLSTLSIDLSLRFVFAEVVSDVIPTDFREKERKKRV